VIGCHTNAINTGFLYSVITTWYMRKSCDVEVTLVPLKIMVLNDGLEMTLGDGDTASF